MTSHVEKRGGVEGLVKKPTGFMTSSWAIAEELESTGRGLHGNHMREGPIMQQFTHRSYAGRYAEDSLTRYITKDLEYGIFVLFELRMNFKKVMDVNMKKIQEYDKKNGHRHGTTLREKSWIREKFKEHVEKRSST